MPKPCKKALIFLADGCEEIEFTVTVDVLRRAEINVCVAGIDGPECVKCMFDVKICPDVSIAEAKHDEYDIIIVPGGTEGVAKFKKCKEIKALLQKQEESDKWIAALCAGPTVLKVNGIGKGKKVTSEPSSKSEMVEGGEYIYLEEKVVVDGKLITSRGPGTTFDFGLTIVEELLGKSVRDKVTSALIFS